MHPLRLTVLALGASMCLVGCVRFQTGPSVPLPARERVLLAERGQLHVLDVNPGAAETVLLVHGYGASMHAFQPLIGALASRLRVLAVDLPGFGRSDRREGDYSPEALSDVLAAVLDAKGVARAHVVGHSWGSSVALAFARRHRDRLDRLVVISGWIYDEQLMPMMRWARVPGLGEGLYATFYSSAFGERIYWSYYDPTQVREADVEASEAEMAEPGAVAAALAVARGMRFAESEREYPRIDAETLLIWGRDDRISRVGFGERLARDLQRARLVVIPRCGHVPMWECRNETLTALTDFLGGGE